MGGYTVYDYHLTIHILGGSADLEEALRQVPLPEQTFCHITRFPAAEGEWTACDVLIVNLPDGEALNLLPRIPEKIQLVLCVGQQELVAIPTGRPYADFWVRPIPAFFPAFRFEKLLGDLRTQRDGYIAQSCLDTVIDSIPDLVWFKDVRGSHEKVNEAFCRAVGKTKENIRGRGHYYIWDMTPKDYAAGEYVCLESEEEVIRKKQTCLFDEKVLSKHGMRQFKTAKSPVFDEAGQIIGTLGVARDVTDLGNISTELEILLRSMPFGILIEDDEGHIIKVNEKLLEYFQIFRDQIEGRPYDQWKKELLRNKVQSDEDREIVVSKTVGGASKIFKFHEDTIFDIFHDPVGRVCILRDVTIERALRERIIRNSNTDFLTGLYNRRYFYRYVSKNRGTQRVSLIYLDLDYFKQINDAHGHGTGDEALALAARLLKEGFPNEFIARLGGDEFLILLLGPWELAELKNRTEQMLHRMREAFHDDPRMDTLSASAGIAQSDDPNEEIDAVIQRSDAALYAAKKHGRACCFLEADERLQKGQMR